MCTSVQYQMLENSGVYRSHTLEQNPSRSRSFTASPPADNDTAFTSLSLGHVKWQGPLFVIFTSATDPQSLPADVLIQFCRRHKQHHLSCHAQWLARCGNGLRNDGKREKDNEDNVGGKRGDKKRLHNS
jgi:hypothetical protein